MGLELVGRVCWDILLVLLPDMYIFGRTSIFVDSCSFVSFCSLLSSSLHQRVVRGYLGTDTYIFKLERPLGFPTSVCTSTLPQLQCNDDRLHLGQTSDVSFCSSDTTSEYAGSGCRENNCKQGPP